MKIEGDEVPVAEVVAYIGEPDEEIPECVQPTQDAISQKQDIEVEDSRKNTNVKERVVKEEDHDE